MSSSEGACFRRRLSEKVSLIMAKGENRAAGLNEQDVYFIRLPVGYSWLINARERNPEPGLSLPPGMASSASPPPESEL